jgi:hypothetical protein
MNQAMKNKEFVLEYLNALSGKDKPREILEHYITILKRGRMFLYMNLISHGRSQMGANPGMF